MTIIFHRLTPPTYFISGGGPLPTGYDYLNDPTSGGSGSGIPAPSDTGPKTGGIYDGVYFVAEDVEQVNAFNTNRGTHALAQNTDYIDGILHGDLVVAIFDQVSNGHGGVASYSLNASVDGLWVSNASVDPTTLFTVTDTFGDPIIIDRSIVVVTSITGATIGTGFSRHNPVVFHFNKTIPDKQGFRVYYGIQASFAHMPFDVIARNDIYRTRKTRGIVAVLSDGSVSTDGDLNSATLDSVIDSSLAYLDPGKYVLSKGNYQVTIAATGWSQRLDISAPEAAVIKLASGRADPLTFSVPTRLEGVALQTASTLATYEITSDFSLDGGGSQSGSIEGGAFKINAGGTDQVRLTDIVITSNATLTAVTQALEITGGGMVMLSGIDATDPRPTAASGYNTVLRVHDFDGTITVEDSRFFAQTAGVSILNFDTVSGEIRFTDCEFRCSTGTSAVTYSAVDSYGIVFENCTFFGISGEVIYNQNTGCTFINCTFESGSNTGVTNPQLIAGEGYTDGDAIKAPRPLCFISCYAEFGAANVRATGAPTKPIVELGGRAATATTGQVVVNGLHICAASSALAVHNYTTVVLHHTVGNRLTNKFESLTIDMKTTVPAATGTLGRFSGSFEGKGLVIEIVGESNCPRLQVRNLDILNVGWPAGDIARGVVGAINAEIHGLTLDGTSTSSGSYTKPIVDLLTSDVYDAKFFPEGAVISTSTVASILKLSNSSRVDRIRYHHQNSIGSIAGPLFLIGDDCAVDAGLIYIDSSLTGGNSIVQMSGVRPALRTTVIYLDDTMDAPMLFNNATEPDVSGNTLTWQNDGEGVPDIVNIVVNRGTTVGNKFMTTGGTAPTVSYIAASTSIPASDLTDLNILGTNASATVPLIH